MKASLESARLRCRSLDSLILLIVIAIQATKHCPKMVSTMLELISYDPNYRYTDEKGDDLGPTSMTIESGNGEGWDDGDNGWGEDGEFGEIEEDQGDESDHSWQVRRAAVSATHL